MGFNGNNSEEVVVNEVKLYHGIQIAKVVAICPNLEEIKALGIKTDKEPVYKQADDGKGNKRVAIDVYAQFLGVDRIQKIRFFLTNTNRVSNDGVKRQLIDQKGKTCWDTLEGLGEAWEWIDSPSVRPCLVGEDQLTDFLVNWLNIKPGDNARLEDPTKFFDLNFKELLDAHRAYPENKFKAMLSVKHADGGKNYQNVYTGYFGRATNKAFTYWEKHFTKRASDGRPFRDTFSYEFQVYTPVAPTTDTTTKKEEVDEGLF